MPSPWFGSGGGDQEARCLVGSVPHLRLDSCCGAHAGGRTLLLRKISVEKIWGETWVDFNGFRGNSWWILWQSYGMELE